MLRRSWKGLRVTILYVLCVSMLVFVLGLLSSERSLHGSELEHVPAMGAASTNPLTQVQDDFLVDMLLSLPTQLPISRVQWSDSGVLSLDIRVASSIHQPTLIYEELYRWLHFSFYETENVNRLELRVVIENKERRQKHVLLAMDTLRSQVTESMLNEFIRKGHPPSVPAMRAMRMSFTTLWTDQFGERAKLEKISPTY